MSAAQNWTLLWMVTVLLSVIGSLVVRQVRLVGDRLEARIGGLESTTGASASITSTVTSRRSPGSSPRGSEASAGGAGGWHQHLAAERPVACGQHCLQRGRVTG